MCGTLLQSFGLVKKLCASKRSLRGAKSGSRGRSRRGDAKSLPATNPGLPYGFWPCFRPACRLKSPPEPAPAVAHLTEHFIVSSIAPAQIAA